MRRVILALGIGVVLIGLTREKAAAQGFCVSCSISVDWNDVNELGWPWTDVDIHCSDNAQYYAGGDCGELLLETYGSGYAMPPIPTCE